MRLPLILTPIHIAFLEMVIDPACSIVFEAEEEEDDVMSRPPTRLFKPVAGAKADLVGDSSSSVIGAFMRRNRSLWILIGGVSALLALALSWPAAQSLFHLGKLHWDDLVVSAVVGITGLLILEGIKSTWFRIAETQVRGQHAPDDIASSERG